MDRQDALIPDLDWLATPAEPDDSWLGPSPKLVNLRPWMDRLSAAGHRTLVAATYAAADTARRHWDAWLKNSPAIAMESILEGRPPTEQLNAVKRWLNSPSLEHKNLAFNTVDHTKQLHWFHEEYREAWFDEPGMWAVESSEHCVLSLTGDPYTKDSVESLATICLACAINSFRKSAENGIREALSVLIDATQRQLSETE